MVDPLPVNYRKAPLAIATFPYSEIIDGTGIVTFLGSRISIDSTAANDKYILITDTINPSANETQMADGGAGIDFDVQFAATKTIDGFAYFSLPVSKISITSLTPSIEVIHYDGSSETTIVAETSMPLLSSGGAQTYGDRVLKVTIPRTKFVIGDILRLTIRFVISGGTAFLMHDPTGSLAAFTRSGGQLKAYIPFEVEI